MRVDDPKTLGESWAEAIRTWAEQHPTVDLLDLMNIHDSAMSAGELKQIMADPEAWLATHPEVGSGCR